MTTVPIAGTVTRRVKRERPDITLGWRDDKGKLLNLAGYTFALTIATSPSGAKLVNKTAGIIYELDPDGEFNVRITFSAGEIDALVASVPYNCQLDATSSGVDRGFQDFTLILTPEHS
jgi:hypothetical protein